MRRAAGGTILLLAGAVAAGCAGPKRGEPLHPAPKTADPAVLQGERVFMVHCHACHPGGAAGLGPSLNDKPLPRFMIRFQVRNGMGAMPSFPESRIGKDDLDALADYLVFLRKAGP